MACKHKFYDDLELERLDFEPTTLIVGTFNPEWPANNTAGWFYGRTNNTYFWDVLPRLYGEESLINATPAQWKQFCKDKRIALTDLISEVEDAEPNNSKHVKMLGGFSDDAIIHNFDELVFINIVQLLRRNPTIKNVYITREITEAFWRHLWGPVKHYCNQNNIHERRLLTPSDTAIDHQQQYNSHHPDAQIQRLEDYLLMKWQQEWHLIS